MIPKIEEAGLKLRYILLLIFVLMGVIASICYACEEYKKENEIPSRLAFWPPDLVPHPPHFPEPKPIDGALHPEDFS